MRLYKNIVTITVLSFIFIFSFNYVSRENHIYFWDYGYYYSVWTNLGGLLLSNFAELLKSVFRSIYYNDYNYSSILPLLPFYWLPLETRFSYILAICLVYFFPLIILFNKIINIEFLEKSNKFNWFFICTILFFSPFWSVILRGFPDISGLICVVVAVMISAKTDLGKYINLKICLSLASCIWMAFLFRRWYAYTIVSLFISLPFLNYYLFKSEDDRSKLKIIFYNFTIIGFISILFLLIFQFDLFKRIISTDYSYIYSGYQLPLGESIKNSILSLGISFIGLAAFFLLIAFRFSNARFKIFSVFYLFNCFFTFFIFTKTQSPSMQHLLPLQLWVLLIFSSSAYVLASQIQDNKFRIGFLLFLSSFIFVNLLISTSELSPKNLRPFFSQQCLPLKLQRTDSYLELVKKIKELCKDGDKVSILSSNAVLNEDLLNALVRYKLSDIIEPVSHVDLRDKLNFSPFLATYVVVTSPAQVHLNEGSQSVITIPVKDILEGQNIGKAYQKTGFRYLLDNGVEAIVYKKVRPFTKSEIKGFINSFYKIYPSWKLEYNNDFLMSVLTSSFQLGDKWGKIQVDNPTTISVHPGVSKPTVIKLELHNVKKLVFTPSNLSCNKNDPILIRIRNNFKDTGFVRINKGDSFVLDVAPWNDSISELVISKNKDVSCDLIRITEIE